MKKMLSVLSSAVLFGSLLVPSVSVAKESTLDLTTEEPNSKFLSQSVEEVLENGDVDFSTKSARTATVASSSVTGEDVGLVKPWVVANNVSGQYGLKNFTLKGVGEYGEVWVANNLNFPTGDPRNESGVSVVTDEQVNYLLNEFDTKMYEQEVEFFGAPAERIGEHSTVGSVSYADEEGRVVILVDNILDENYYDNTYPSYIAGYFSSTISDLTDRNVMTVDSLDWANRTGADAARPYMYEGTFAHEFQHLLHRDIDSAEENFINEGLSDFAQYLVGYGHSEGHVNFFMNNLKNSLTSWEDQGGLQILGDYGNAYLFQLYLYEQFGEEFIQREFQHQAQGIDSINAVLKEMGVKKTFQSVYQDYMAALLIDDKYEGDKKTYNFESIDLNPNIDAAATLEKVAPAWGADFKVITPSKKLDHLYFKGIDFLGTSWQVMNDAEKGNVLWGNEGNQTDNFLIKELDLTNKTNPVLSFDTKYDIEEDWDFGVVQVSTDNGETWTSLGNEHTTDSLVENGYPTIAENLPGFTGNSNGWVTENFDLSRYAGQQVQVAFRYMTDWGSNGDGWFVSNLKLDGKVVDSMKSVDGFVGLDELTGDYVNYQVQFVGYKKSKGVEQPVKIMKLPSLMNMSQTDKLDLRGMLKSAQYSKVVMMVTYAPEAGKGGSAGYDYEVVMK